MNKKTAFISIGASIIVAASVIIPISIIYSKKNNPSINEKSITFTFEDIEYQGPREAGGSYWELGKDKGSPTGEYDFKTRNYYEDEHWNYFSYVDGHYFDTIGSHIVTIYEDVDKDIPNCTFHFEFVLPPDATFTSVSAEGQFYTNKELTTEVTKITYSSDILKPITIVESINEYYQIVLDKITFTYVDK